MAGYAYHNLASSLRTVYKFGTARRYLKKAKSIAQKYNDPLLRQQIEILEEEIRTKNRDIPDYINGETGDD